MANKSRLVLPKPMVAKLQSLGIYCQTWVTAERQDRAKRWVLPGVESGGSAKEFGRYISFFAADGSRMEWLQKADRIGANGVHAVAIGADLVGVEMARVDETYQLVISRHQLGKPKTEGKRPPVESSVIFRGVDGQLSEKLWKQGFLPYSETAQESCLRLMGKKLMASLPTEGKLHADGLQSMDADDDLLTAMARDLVTRQGVGEAAADVWKNLVGRHREPAEVLDTALPAALETLISVQETNVVETATWIRPVGPAVQLSLF
jgi:hypothetical protein